MSSEPFVTIGSHSVSHISLPNISIEGQKKELSDSKKILEIWTERKVNYFAYPSGDYSDNLKSIAKECGYELCFTIDTPYIDIEKVDKLSIPRMCVNDDAGNYEALSKMYGIWYKVISH
jgi:peptidoglycan/xylan/chitin deacetylase (PgdA/CDA1 family)